MPANLISTYKESRIFFSRITYIGSKSVIIVDFNADAGDAAILYKRRYRST